MSEINKLFSPLAVNFGQMRNSIRHAQVQKGGILGLLILVLPCQTETDSSRRRKWQINLAKIIFPQNMVGRAKGVGGTGGVVTSG